MSSSRLFICELFAIFAGGSKDTVKSIATAAVARRLDYCNSILFGSSVANMQRTQRVQNSFARVVTRARRSQHITPVLAKRHWLPIQYRVQFKLALIPFKAFTTRTPHYLSELVRLYEPSRQLRSRGKNLKQQDMIRRTFSGRAFRHSAPAVWNNLPQTVISDISVSLHTCKSRLKTELNTVVPSDIDAWQFPHLRFFTLQTT